jgi:hypothetical protein
VRSVEDRRVRAPPARTFNVQKDKSKVWLTRI